jgi:hypothetical protein
MVRLSLLVPAAGLAVLLAAPQARAGAQVKLDPAGTVAVVVTYADGRRMPITVGPNSGGAWTPLFPRVASWTPPANQQPVGAIKFACLRTSAGVSVAVSVFRGSQRQQDEPIKTVLVTPDQAVVVGDELRAVGVEAVTLTLASLTTSDVAAPSVVVASTEIEVVDVVVAASPVPKYTVSLRNHSTKAVRAIAIEASRAGRLALSARRFGHEGDVLIAPGGSYVLDMPVPVARPAPDGSVNTAPIDRIDIAAVIWSDESYDGKAGPALSSLISDYGDRLQLARVLSELQRVRAAGAAATVSELRAALLSLAVDVTDAMIDDARSRPANVAAMSRDQTASALRVSLASIKKTVLDDLTDFESGRIAPGAFQGWMNTTIDRYQRWFDRQGGR